jgi:hypothetical protein
MLFYIPKMLTIRSCLVQILVNDHTASASEIVGTYLFNRSVELCFFLPILCLP